MFKEQGLDAVILKHNIDSPFISHVEQLKENVRFLRIDADVSEAVKEEDGKDLEEETKELSEIFKKALNKDNLTVKAGKPEKRKCIFYDDDLRGKAAVCRK